MGVAIIGGLIMGSVLTLFVIPAMYMYLTGKTRRLSLAEQVNGKGERKEQKELAEA
jgi:multidrug efflux pump